MKPQTTHNAEYMQALFTAIQTIIEQPSTVGSDSTKLELIKELAETGFEGKVLASGPEDFIHAISWLKNKQIEINEEQLQKDDLATTHPLVLRLNADRLHVLLESVHESMYSIEDEQATEARTLIGWGAEVAEKLKEDLAVIAAKEISDAK